MNTDQDRPYICTAPGCSQCFQREDHLIIHRHKHEMTLKFPAIKCDNALSDQTPTPTRFLRNCEEVGLFSDLELNQASEEDDEEEEQDEEEEEEEEDEKEEITSHKFAVQGLFATRQRECNEFQHQQRPQCALANLHDSHVHKHTSSPCSVPRQQHINSSTNTQRTAAACLHNSLRLPSTCAMQASSPMQINTQVTTDPCMIDIPGLTHRASTPQRSKVMPCQTHPIVSNENQNPMDHMMGMMSSPHQTKVGMTLTHLPGLPYHSYQQHCPSQLQPKNTDSHRCQDQPSHSCAHHSPPAHQQPGSTYLSANSLAHQLSHAQLSPTPQNTSCAQSPPQTSGGKRRRTGDEDPDERRRRFLERNRAAASRCRQKRKVWVNSLEKKAEELTQTNLQLQNEVTLLKSEVIQLKQLLLAHKDCPVTVRQRETQVGSPTGSPTQRHTIQHNISTSSGKAAHSHLTTHPAT